MRLCMCIKLAEWHKKGIASTYNETRERKRGRVCVCVCMYALARARAKFRVQITDKS